MQSETWDVYIPFVPRYIRRAVEAVAETATPIAKAIKETFNKTLEQFEEELIELRTSLMRVLRPFDEARQAVADMIYEASLQPNPVWWSK